MKAEDITVQDITAIESTWKQGNYNKALSMLIDYREQPGGKNPYVDYMIATSACRISNKRDIGVKFFTWMLNYYNLSNNFGLLISLLSRQKNNKLQIRNIF